MSLLSQRRHGVFELLAVSFEFYSKNLTNLLSYGVILAITNQIINKFSQNLEVTEENFLTILPNILGIITISMIVGCIIYGAMIFAIEDRVNNRQNNLIGCFQNAGNKLLTLVIAAFLYGLAIMTGTLLLIIPGLILFVSLLFSSYFIILENNGALESLKNSHRLVWGNWWFVNIALFIPYFFYAVLVIVDVIAYPDSQFDLFHYILTGATDTFVTPYLTVVGYVLYHELKLRQTV